jgi:hypothetical protein
VNLISIIFRIAATTSKFQFISGFAALLSRVTSFRCTIHFRHVDYLTSVSLLQEIS